MRRVVTANDPEFGEVFEERYRAARSYSDTLEGPSLAEQLAAHPKCEHIVGSLEPHERYRLLYDWQFWSRPKQRVQPDKQHMFWLWLAGRRFGKNRAAAERVRERVESGVQTACIIGNTYNEVMTYMLGGHKRARGNGSGLLDVFPPHVPVELNKQDQYVYLPTLGDNGSRIYYFSAEKKDFRGGGYGLMWLDEICLWRYLQEIWSNIELSMSDSAVGDVETIITTTPRPMTFLRELVVDPDVVTIVANSDDNRANLARGYLERISRKIGGTRLERQERYAEILGDNPNALFMSSLFDKYRVIAAPELVRIVVAVDPNISTAKDPAGIVVMGIDRHGELYILADYTSDTPVSPNVWGATALQAYEEWKADAFVAERNRGGDLVKSNLQAAMRSRWGHENARVIEVNATRGKAVRAEPVSAMQEQGKLHVVGVLRRLEDELSQWDPALSTMSPNRLDAVVWGAFELAKLGSEPEPDRSGQARAATAAARELNTLLGNRVKRVL